jgi:Ca2+-binding EF-hand superfamily protein
VRGPRGASRRRLQLAGRRRRLGARMHGHRSAPQLAASRASYLGLEHMDLHGKAVLVHYKRSQSHKPVGSLGAPRPAWRAPAQRSSGLSRGPSMVELVAANQRSKFDQLTFWLRKQEMNDAARAIEGKRRGLLRVEQQAAAAARPSTPQQAVLSGKQSEDAGGVASAAERAKLKSSSFVKGAADALNSRFSDMFKAFQYVDLDRSGTLDEKEITRALDLWNIPMDQAKLRDLIAACDNDGDGEVDYKEFVDVLARDTVAPAAMAKRSAQPVHAASAVQHVARPDHRAPPALANAATRLSTAQPATAFFIAKQNERAGGMARPASSSTMSSLTRSRSAVELRSASSVHARPSKPSAFVRGAADALNSRFSDMFKAFQYIDLDRSGTLDFAEIKRALNLWNIPIDEAKLHELIATCDHDGDGEVDYKEFVDVLARDTVAPAAMGKRGMQM